MFAESMQLIAGPHTRIVFKVQGSTVQTFNVQSNETLEPVSVVQPLRRSDPGHL